MGNLIRRLLHWRRKPVALFCPECGDSQAEALNVICPCEWSQRVRQALFPHLFKGIGE